MNLKEYLLALKNRILELDSKKRTEYVPRIGDIVEETKEEILPKTEEKALPKIEEKVLPKTEEEINALLESEIQDFFPKTGNWYSYCFGKPSELGMGYLPCHLRDNKWLARMLQQEKKLQYISLDKIFNFISSSGTFAELRHNYELEIVKWQINWIRNGGENWLISEDLGGDLCLMMPQCDIAFRKGVVDTLKAIGMNEDVIEEGLEKNASMWRDRYISSAFGNTFDSVFDMLGYNIDSPSEEHKNAWIRMREFEYYQKHKKSVDLYGQATEAMKMSDEEITQLQMYLTQKSAERIHYIEECKKDPAKKRELKFW